MRSACAAFKSSFWPFILLIVLHKRNHVHFMLANDQQTWEHSTRDSCRNWDRASGALWFLHALSAEHSRNIATISLPRHAWRRWSLAFVRTLPYICTLHSDRICVSTDVRRASGCFQAKDHIFVKFSLTYPEGVACPDHGSSNDYVNLEKFMVTVNINDKIRSTMYSL